MKRGDYRDPMIVLEERQSGSCLGCKALLTTRIAIDRQYQCLKNQRPAALSWMQMKKCSKYTGDSE